MPALDRLRSIYATRFVSPAVASRYVRACLTCRNRAVMDREELRAVKQMHRVTNGLSTDIFNAMSVQDRHSETSVLDRLAQVAGVDAARTTKAAVDSIRERGFFVFPNRMAADVVDELRGFSLREPAIVEPPRPDGPRIEIFRPEQPTAEKFAIHGEKINLFTPAREIALSSIMRATAEIYLRRAPILSTLQMWWSAKYSPVPCSEVAQYYHYDFSHPKWLKYFIYLTEVTPNTGPHCLVPTTHKRDRAGRPYRTPLRSRITDEEIEAAYPGCQIELYGPAGTILAVDTRCWHKGKVPTSDHRLILEIYFTSHAVGESLPPEHLAIFGDADGASIGLGRDVTELRWAHP